MYKIMIVEDDATISQAVQEKLRSWGYEAHSVGDFQSVVKEFVDISPHLVLLDISLPYYNGYHWCREIRRISSVPVIFLSSASDNMNVVMALSQGGDNFIAKPFDMEILIAKVEAILRRTYAMNVTLSVLEHHGMILNLADSTLDYEGKRLELTKNEFRILQILFENRDKVVSRDKIMMRLWESDSYIDDNTLTVNVTRLRRNWKRLDFIFETNSLL